MILQSVSSLGSCLEAYSGLCLHGHVGGEEEEAESAKKPAHRRSQENV